MFRTSLALFVLAALLSFAGGVQAQSAAGSNEEVAEQLAAQAIEAFQREDFAEASRLFGEAFRLDPHPVILFNLARANQENGTLPDALLYFRTLAEIDAPANIIQAAAPKIQEIEELLRAQGYDPQTVTAATYIPRGEMTIVTQPEGATVHINGNYAGTTPYRATLVDQGRYNIRIDLEGYHPVTQDLEVVGMQATLRTFSLTPRTTLEEYVPPSPGYLTVRAPASSLLVELDGEQVGYTPLLAHRLAPGTYRLRVSGPGWHTATQQVVIDPGEEAELMIRMQASDVTVVDPNRGRRLTGIALMATGGAMMATGAVFGGLALRDADAYRADRTNPDRMDLRNRAQNSALIADIAIPTGAAVALTGVIFRYVLGKKDANIDRGLLVRATGGPGLGMGLNATW